MRFKNKNIIVTGAGSGIGKACAERFAREGAYVLCVDINLDTLEQVVKAITADGGQAELALVDQTDSTAVQALVNDFAQARGQLDCVANIAGIGAMAKIEEETVENYLKIMAVNAHGPFYFCHAAIPYLLESKGNIVNLASTAGIIGQAYTSAYCASKHAVVGLTKALALELARKGVRVNAVCPGSVNTPMISDFSLPDNIDVDLIGRYGLQPDFCLPEDVASMVAYVASDEAHYVNGSILSVDGGSAAG